MAVNDCPHCGKPALSFWRKSFLGPARSSPCQSCSKRVSVSWAAMWTAAPVILVAAFPVLSGSAPDGIWIAALVVATVISMVLQWYYVPLVAR